MFSDSKIKAVFFDFSDVLFIREIYLFCDTLDFVKRHNVKKGYKFYRETFKDFFMRKEHWDLNSALTDFAQKMQPKDIEKFVEEQRFFFDMLSESKLNKPLMDIIKELRRMNIKIGILANIDSFTFQLLKRNEVETYFDYLLPSFKIGYYKPEHGFFESVIKKTCLRKDEILYVGNDTMADLEPAKAFGFKALRYKFGTDFRSEILKNI